VRNTRKIRQHIDIAQIGSLWRIIQYRESGRRDDESASPVWLSLSFGKPWSSNATPKKLPFAPDKAARAPQIVEGQFEGDGQNRQTLLVNPCPAVREVGKVDVTRALTGLAAKKQRRRFADFRPAVGPSIIHIWYRSSCKASPTETGVRVSRSRPNLPATCEYLVNRTFDSERRSKPFSNRGPCDLLHRWESGLSGTSRNATAAHARACRVGKVLAIHQTSRKSGRICVQKRDHRNRQMKHRYHFGSHCAVPKEVARVSALISDLDRVARILESDISTEEKRAGVSDPQNTAYPSLARIMTARRNNLKETIGALERRLSSQPVKADSPA
jgi:hypothetical protein